MPVKQVSAGHLKQELKQAGDKLVVIDFFATWCGPCNGIAPIIEKLSQSYPNAVFLKIDVDSCKDETEEYKVSAMPTFVFIRNSKELERIRGADQSAIERTLSKHYKTVSTFSGQGHSMLSSGTQASSTASTTESEIRRFEQLAKERWATDVGSETVTTLRLRFPDIPTPINVRLSTNRTLYDVRRLLSDTISSFQAVAFEFLQPPAMKISLDDEEKTINELKLCNAVLNVRKIL